MQAWHAHYNATQCKLYSPMTTWKTTECLTNPLSSPLPISFAQWHYRN